MIVELIEKLKLKIDEQPARCYFNDAADYFDLCELEDAANFVFPHSFTTFICNYDGGFISPFDPAKNIDIESQAWNSNTFLRLAEIEDEIDRLSYKQIESKKLFIPFLRTAMGEYLAFAWPYENQESKIYDIWHEAPPLEWERQVVYENFTDLLKDYIENNGRITTIG